MAPFTLNRENVNVMLEFPLRPCACILRDLRLCSKNVLIRILKNMAQNMRPLQIFKSLFAHAQLNDDIKIKKIKKIIDGLLCVRAGLARPLTKCFLSLIFVRRWAPFYLSVELSLDPMFCHFGLMSDISHFIKALTNTKLIFMLSFFERPVVFHSLSKLMIR